MLYLSCACLRICWTLTTNVTMTVRPRKYRATPAQLFFSVTPHVRRCNTYKYWALAWLFDCHKFGPSSVKRGLLDKRDTRQRYETSFNSLR